MIAHIRMATQGSPLLRNVRFPSNRFRWISDTDQGHAFCALLERLAPAWGDAVPSLESKRLDALVGHAARIALEPWSVGFSARAPNDPHLGIDSPNAKRRDGVSVITTNGEAPR